VAAPETVWAALDCPSYQPASDGDPAPYLLGTLTVRQERPVRLDTDHVLLGWPIGREGRRVTSTSALVGPGGEVCARARAVWFAVPPSARDPCFTWDIRAA
jgi:acyl-CoA thioesterase FadM